MLKPCVRLIVISQLLLLSTQYNRKLDNYTSTILPDLPPEHLKRFLNTFPKIRSECEQIKECQNILKTFNNISQVQGNEISSAVKEGQEGGLCWGHEINCTRELRFQTPSCSGDHTGWVQSKEAQINTFYYQADFGYIQQQINELLLMCEPKFLTDSSLECNKYLKFCRGRNLLFDFRNLAERAERIRYHMDVLNEGGIKGYCRFNKSLLTEELSHMGALQSWSPELRNFVEADESIIKNETICDMVISTPTFLMKIDATYNMYHHFCDFFNLFATLFVNQTHPSAFDLNTQVIIWETYPYDSPFAVTFKAFSKNPVWTLDQVKGQRICFRNVVLPLLPRMIFGLYYNTPLIQGCEKSGLFRAFSEFILHRLRIPFHPPRRKIRITFLARRTKYRRVLNEDELIAQLASDEEYIVKRISFERGLNFLEQLTITRNTDILIGVHGAGLTHLLFLPEWAGVFELYNCEDPNCYRDLARLRGVHYITWEKRHLVYPQDEGHHPEGGAHAKFTNYSFDVKEFARLVSKLANYVRNHKNYKEFIKNASPPREPKDKEEL
uniref:EGF domain-specific O-linked N-acetylglucosamine transferase n=1 Tax=Glossina pallidipes TaxID=7398 RepID=A0A1B0A1J7_GLOPL